MHLLGLMLLYAYKRVALTLAPFYTSLWLHKRRLLALDLNSHDHQESRQRLQQKERPLGQRRGRKTRDKPTACLSGEDQKTLVVNVVADQ